MPVASMRLTRAALRAELTESIDTTDASTLQSDAKLRIPLGEVSSNALPELADVQDTQTKKMPPKKLRKGAAKKAAKGKKVEDEAADPQVLEDERQAAGSPASDAAVDELANGPTDDIVQVPINDTRPASPPSRAVRMTRRQLAKLEEEELSKSQPLASLPLQPQPAIQEIIDDALIIKKEEEPVTEPGTTISEVEGAVAIKEPGFIVPDIEEVDHIQEPANVVEATQAIEAVVPEAFTPETKADVEAQAPEPVVLEAGEVVDVQKSEVIPPAIEKVGTVQAPSMVVPEIQGSSEPEPKTLTTGKVHEENSTPATSRTPSRTPSRASSRNPSRSPMRLEESIEAIDALEEALDEVGQALYLSDHSTDEKSPQKAHFSDIRINSPKTRAKTSNTPQSSSNSSNLSRNHNVHRSLKPPTIPVKSSLSRSSSVRTAPSKDVRKGSGEVADYLASKRRPISMSFPTPPPPTKSSKPPTQVKFQLPGEAVAAKLKAQKEERLRRDADGEVVKQSTISMPPRPKSSKPPTVSTFQLPGEAVAAKLKAQKEERLRREATGTVVKQRPISMPPPPKSTKLPTVANFQLPGEVFAARLKAQKEERLKREEQELAKKPSFRARPAPVYRNAPSAIRQTSSSKAREDLMTKEGQAPSSSSPFSKRPGMMDPSTTNKRSSAVLTRPAFNLSTTTSSSKRSSLLLSQGLSTITPADAAAQRVKAREQFLKDKAESELKRKERLGKEDAAKRARDEAAELGRIRSREWAEKHKRRLIDSASTERTGSVPKVEESA